MYCNWMSLPDSEIIFVFRSPVKKTGCAGHWGKPLIYDVAGGNWSKLSGPASDNGL